MDQRQHWDTAYGKPDEELGWTQTGQLRSLEFIAGACAGGRVVDIGGGTSPLAEQLLDRGYAVTVVDVSPLAMERARRRLGEKADRIRWIAGDVTAGVELEGCEVWHDRAMFHFLIEPAARAAYRELMAQTVVTGGHVVMATFAPDGPPRCSGLDVLGYDGPSLAAELGPAFTLLHSAGEIHVTPHGGRQAFQYSLFRRR